MVMPFFKRAGPRVAFIDRLKRIKPRQARLPLVLLVLMLITLAGGASAGEAGGYEFHGVDRIVAIGDIHGNWEGYITTLRAAELIDDRNRWRGGKAHLVQIGDIPDRGPDTLRIIEHLQRLKRQARRAGGRVHHLIGNHEAMNVYGDLRYVTSGEFEAFADRNSDRLRERYLDALMERMESQDPRAFRALPSDFRERWRAEHPEGWLEHRYAWSPLWDEDAELYAWVAESAIAIRVNDLLFVHAGISLAYCSESLESLTDKAHDALDGRSDEELGILVDPLGPLWYRGLSGAEPEASLATVEAILKRYEANHIVVGHTPTGGVIYPRYGNRVIQIDVGIGEAYGGHVAFLEVTSDGLYAGYRNGRVPLPQSSQELADYARGVAALHPDDEELLNTLEDLELGQTAPASYDEAAVQPEARVSCGIAQ